MPPVLDSSRKSLFSTVSGAQRVTRAGCEQASIVIEEFADSYGILLRRTVVAAGVDDIALTRAVRQQRLVRLRQGAYVLTPVWRTATPRGRHLLLARSVDRVRPRQAALSHVSAALAYGAPDWMLPLAHAHLTSPQEQPHRRLAGVAHHVGSIRLEDAQTVDGLRVTSAAQTALDIASSVPRDPAVCVLDWFLERGLTTKPELRAGAARMRHWPGTLTLGHRIELADGRSQSVGETRSRLIFRDQAIPPPELQYVVHRADGSVAGICDFAWPEFGLLGEFDGERKYLANRLPGQSIERAVLAEKQRENLLRQITGFAMVRFDWFDLDRPAEMGAVVRDGLILPRSLRRSS